ncbi:MAG: ribose-phosphate diphosphokinase, partial [Myxococcota bacterium]
MESRAPLCLVYCDPAADLAEGIGRVLRVPSTPSEDVWFPSGEAKHIVSDNVRGHDVYVFQRTITPGGDRSVYDNFMMALHAADALKLADADRVTLVMPYLPGTRQDKRKLREGVSTGLFARLIMASGVSMVVTVEPHDEALVAGYDPRHCVLESVSLVKSFAKFIVDKGLSFDVVASPDVGGLENARFYAQTLNRDLAALSKERDYSKTSVVMRSTVLGDVSGRDILLVDDIVDTAGSVVSAVRALWAEGARGVTVACAHPVLSGPAWSRLHELRSEAEERGVAFAFCGTGSVMHPDPPDWYYCFSLEPLLAEVVKRINNKGAV